MSAMAILCSVLAMAGHTHIPAPPPAISEVSDWTGEMLVDGVPTFFVIESADQADGVSLVTLPSMGLARAEATRTLEEDGTTTIRVPFMDQSTGLFTLGRWAATDVEHGEGFYDISRRPATEGEASRGLIHERNPDRGDAVFFQSPSRLGPNKAHARHRHQRDTIRLTS